MPLPAEFDIAGATYYAVAPSGYSYSAEQDAAYGSRKYTTVAAAEAALPASLSAPAVINILGSWASPDTAAVTFNGTVTSATSYLLVRAIGSARHDSKWSSTAYRLERTNSGAITIRNHYTTLQGIQVDMILTGTTSQTGIVAYVNTAGVILCDSLIVRAQISGTNAAGFGIQLADASGNAAYEARNCIAYGWTNGAENHRGFRGRGGTGDSIVFNNCTAVACATGFERSLGTVAVQNCLAQDCTDGFSGTFAAGSTNNCSDIVGDAPGSNPRTGDVSFVDATAKDFHLASTDTVALGYGADLSATFGDDIDGQTRAGAWDIGADQYVSSGQSLTQSCADAMSVGDVMASQLAMVRSFADTVSLGDSMGRAAAFARSLSDAASLGDSLGSSAAFLRSFSDAVALGENVNASLVILKSIADALSLSDTSARALAIVRAYSDAVTMADAVSRQVAYIRSLSEPLMFGESVVTAATFRRQVTEAFSLGDSTTGALVLVKALADALTIEDSVQRAAAFFRILQDAVQLEDILQNQQALVHQLSDAVAIGDSVLTAAIFRTILEDALSLSELVAANRVISQMLSDALSIAESLNANAVFATSTNLRAWVQPRTSRGRIQSRLDRGRISAS